MLDLEEILVALKKFDIALVGAPVRDANVENKFYAFVQVTRPKGTAQVPSNHQLKNASDLVAVLGAEMTFIMVEDNRQDLLLNSKGMLMRQFPDLIRNVFATHGTKGVIAWIEPKRVLTGNEIGDLRTKLEEFLRILKSPLEAVLLTSSENIPTRTACLTSLRYLAPTSNHGLRADLERRGFRIPSEEWLAHTLDGLRKSGLILRSTTGMYTLTLSGLKSLGSAKNRNSPDIVRALAMARRGA